MYNYPLACILYGSVSDEYSYVLEKTVSMTVHVRGDSSAVRIVHRITLQPPVRRSTSYDLNGL